MRLAEHYFLGYDALLGYLRLAIAEAIVPQRFELTPDLLGCEKLVYRCKASEVPHFATIHLAEELHDNKRGGGKGVVHYADFFVLLFVLTFCGKCQPRMLATAWLNLAHTSSSINSKCIVPFL